MSATAPISDLTDRREYPARPIVGVAGVVLDGARVLLIQRGREPQLGTWSLPGGALELGETTAEGVVREVREETGVSVQPLALVATLDRIVRDDDGAVRFHYVLVDWSCVPTQATPATPVCGSDATDARWVPLDALEPYDLAPATLDVIDRAYRSLPAGVSR